MTTRPGPDAAVFAINERPRASRAASESTGAHAPIADLRESIETLMRQGHGLRLDLAQQRRAAGETSEELRALLRALGQGIERVMGLARAAQRGEQGGELPARWCKRIERLERDLTMVAQTAGLSFRMPVGRPQPGADEVVDTVDSDTVESGDIVEVLQQGLLFRGEVLRRAEVTVAR